ncbi:MAG: restriction endonuclease subunit S [Halodesulfurarchaeum sp.]|nr:restriction endonuclease subunit S [Halodesulfurarchaeum sp.]
MNYPSHWTISELDDIVDVQSGVAFPKEYQGNVNKEIPFFKVKDLQKTDGGRRYLDDADNYVSEDESKDLSNGLIPENSIIFPKVGEAIKLNRRGILRQDSLIDNNLMAIHLINEEMVLDYIYYYFLTVRLETFTRATTVPSIRQSDVKEIKVPVPPHSEQKMIVSKIDELFSQLDSGISELENAKQRLEQYWTVIFNAAIQGLLTEKWRRSQNIDSAYVDVDEKSNWTIPSHWDTGPLKEFYNVVPGKAFSSSDFKTSGVPVIKIGNVSHNEFKESHSDHLAEEFLDEHPRRRVEPGSLLLALTRPITKNRVKICKYPGDKERGLLNQRVALIESLDENEIELPLYFLQSSYFKSLIEDDSSKTLQPNLSSVSLRDFTFPLPPKNEQKQIISEIERQQSILQETQKTSSYLINKGNQLRQSILKQAFEGNLLSQRSNAGKAKQSQEQVDGKSKSGEQVTLSGVISDGK